MSIQAFFHHWNIITIGGAKVKVDDAHHAHTADKVRVGTINVKNALHAHVVDRTPVKVKPRNALHAHQADNVLSELFVDNSAHGHIAQNVPVVARVRNAFHAHSVDHIPALVGDGIHTHEADELTVLAGIKDATHGHVASIARAEILVNDSHHTHEAGRVQQVGLFKFSTHACRANDIKPYPVILLELASGLDKFTEHTPAAGKYDKRIINFPEVSEQTSGLANTGIRVSGDVTIVLSNKDKFFALNDLRDLRNYYSRLWLLRHGVLEKIHEGKVSSIKVKEESVIVLRDFVKAAFFDTIPYRFITTDEFPTAKDVGKPIGIAVGRVARLPFYNVEWDDLNRIYRYVGGEGVGYNDGNWNAVFTMYKDFIACKEVSGDVVSSTSTVTTIESADARPLDFYKFQYIRITAGQGIGQIRKIIAHNEQNKVTVDTPWSPVPNSSSDYLIREWRFYDGSQVSPYPGYAIVEFQKPFIDGSRILPIYGDVDALQEEKNFARFYQSILSNTTWGKGLEVNQKSFDDAAVELSDLLCETGLLEPEPIIDIVGELAQVRGLWLT